MVFGSGAVVCCRVHEAHLCVGASGGGECTGVCCDCQQQEVPPEVLEGSVEDVELHARLGLNDQVMLDDGCKFVGALGEEAYGSVYGAFVVPGSPVAEAWGRARWHLSGLGVVTNRVDASFVFAGVES